MKFRIHYIIDDNEDHFIVEGETIEEIKDKATEELNQRQIPIDMAWSEQL